jgi:hypothetical protein
MFPLTVDQLGFVAAGFLSVLVLALSWALSKRSAFEKGYHEGKHDQEHWETEQIVRGKLEK